MHDPRERFGNTRKSQRRIDTRHLVPADEPFRSNRARKGEQCQKAAPAFRTEDDKAQQDQTQRGDSGPHKCPPVAPCDQGKRQQHAKMWLERQQPENQPGDERSRFHQRHRRHEYRGHQKAVLSANAAKDHGRKRHRQQCRIRDELVRGDEIGRERRPHPDGMGHRIGQQPEWQDGQQIGRRIREGDQSLHGDGGHFHRFVQVKVICRAGIAAERQLCRGPEAHKVSLEIVAQIRADRRQDNECRQDRCAFYRFVECEGACAGHV